MEPLPPRERKKLADQLAALLGGPLGHSEDALLLIAERRSPLEQAEAADDGIVTVAASGRDGSRPEAAP